MNPQEFLLDIDDPAALDWAAQLSAPTREFADEAVRERVLSALDSDAKIPYVTRRGEFLYNFWRDARHPRGVWRRTTLEGYAEDEWDVLLDVDALADAEGERWVYKGVSVCPRSFDRALVKLSRGGADAVVVREFDLDTREFVSDGFVLPEAKSWVSWVDRDAVLVCTDFGDGSLTVSGYPGSSRLWRRGESLEDAEEFFSGQREDLLVSAWADTTEGFERKFVRRALDFYTSRTFVETSSGLQVLEVPEDATVVVSREWMFVMPRSAWCGIPLGGLGVIRFDDFLAGSREFVVVYAPSASSSVQDVSFTAGYVLLTLLDDVASRIVRIDYGRWDDHCEIALPELVTASVVSSDVHSDEAWISASSFTQPSTLYRFAGDELVQVRSTPAMFDSRGLSTRQHFATSADGTKVPYFITGSFTSEPQLTLVSAYGGFEHALVPFYPVARGSWLEQGRYYVQANLRGGSEYGPRWHEQILKTNRYKIYEDHQAVLKDLVERGYARSEQIVVRGGSNGGLLTSVALTSYPELIGAAVVQVPLTDMMRYHLWSAGASWMAEYGDPEVAEEREALLAYSPLHNISPASKRSYPPVLVTTSTRDDRVHPAHARLFTLALKEAGHEVDYFENPEGGHAGAADNEQVAFMESLVEGWINTKVAGALTSKN